MFLSLSFILLYYFSSCHCLIISKIALPVYIPGRLSDCITSLNFAAFFPMISLRIRLYKSKPSCCYNMFAHEHEILLPAALEQKGCKVNHFFIPAKILSKKISDNNSLTHFLSSINPFELRLSLKAGAKVATIFLTCKFSAKIFML